MARNSARPGSLRSFAAACTALVLGGLASVQTQGRIHAWDSAEHEQFSTLSSGNDFIQIAGGGSANPARKLHAQDLTPSADKITPVLGA